MTTAKPSSPPLPPSSVPPKPPVTIKASLVSFCPVRNSKLLKTVSSTELALPLTTHAVWSKLGRGPIKVSLLLLPTSLVMRENPPVTPLAEPASRFTLTAAPRPE